MKNLTKKQKKIILESLVNHLLVKPFPEEMIYGTPYMRITYKAMGIPTKKP